MFGIYFLGNHFSSILTSSGAFEVVFNNEVLYSKLETKAFPDFNNIYLLLKDFFN